MTICYRDTILQERFAISELRNIVAAWGQHKKLIAKLQVLILRICHESGARKVPDFFPFKNNKNM